ncbi:MAG: hypothetical protein SCK28_11965 [Bacillota bacterium]|nr:hypothetical protein [Bacillota bacterium]
MNKRIKPYYIVLLIIITISIVLVGCGFKVGYKNGFSVKEMNASFSALSDTKEKTIEIKKGKTITFDYTINITEGTLNAKFEDSLGNKIIVFEPNTKGKKYLKIDKDDTFKIIIKSDNAKGNYKFKWDIE